MTPKRPLTIQKLFKEATRFASSESTHDEPSLYGVTDGKAVGTYLEHKFTDYLAKKYDSKPGNSAFGIDFPDLALDIKTTSIRQPQSSCPYKSARQKIFGLGYNLLVFVYDKSDDHTQKTCRLSIVHAIYIDKERTADYQTTKGLREILSSGANADDLVAFMQDRLLPCDEIEARRIAEDLLKEPPRQGYLTISNALQWRLQYSRVITVAGSIDGVIRVS